jgi:TonB family protein
MRSGLKVVLILFSFLFLGLSVHAQQMLDTIFFDRNWQQSSKNEAEYFREVYWDTTGKMQFIVKDYYSSGSLQMQGTYTSINPDNRNGHFVYYYANGNKQMECDFQNNEVEGMNNEWFANGLPKTFSRIHNGQLDGLYQVWNEDGHLKLEIEYKNGELNGRFLSYYNNGQQVRNDSYKNGKPKNKHCYTRDGRDTTWFPYFIMPAFPGGEGSFKKFITEHLKYPFDAWTQRIEGQVNVEFSINQEGQVVKAKIVKGDKHYFNEEALRVVNESPQWQPGKKDGEVVEVTITVPIRFKLKQMGN